MIRLVPSTMKIGILFCLGVYKVTGFSVVSTQTGIAEIAGIDSDRPQKVNQDGHFHETLQGSEVWGVLDGHGLKGHVVSQFLAKELPLEVDRQLKSLESAQELEEELRKVVDLEELKRDCPKQQALVNAFHHCHWNARMNTTIPTGRSGTTAVVALMHEDLLYTACVGDSKAILVYEDGTSECVAHSVTAKCMDSEKDRIDRLEGRVDDGGNVWYGPIAIAMTRALGDAVMLPAGIIPTPVTQAYKLPVGRNRLVVASDGVWDVLTDDQVVELLSGNCQGCAEQIAAKARERWIGHFIDEKADDITCIVAELSVIKYGN